MKTMTSKLLTIGPPVLILALLIYTAAEETLLECSYGASPVMLALCTGFALFSLMIALVILWESEP